MTLTTQVGTNQLVLSGVQYTSGDIVVPITGVYWYDNTSQRLRASQSGSSYAIINKFTMQKTATQANTAVALTGTVISDLFFSMSANQQYTFAANLICSGSAATFNIDIALTATQPAILVVANILGWSRSRNELYVWGFCI